MTDPYIDPASGILRNKHGLTNSVELGAAEAWHTRVRLEEGSPSGGFDLSHLKAIHRHLFQDTYDWAGEIRTVGISKGGDVFMPARLIETGMRDVYNRLEKAEFLRGRPRDQFAREAAVIIGDINHIHPFREGNGRTQREYLLQLAYHAGHRLELSRLDPKQWIEASRTSHHGKYDLMADQIRAAIAERTIDIDAIAQDRGRGDDRER